MVRQLNNLLGLLLLATCWCRLGLGLGSQISWGDLDVNLGMLGRLRLWTCKLLGHQSCEKVLKARRELRRHEYRDTLCTRLTRLLLRSLLIMGVDVCT